MLARVQSIEEIVSKLLATMRFLQDQVDVVKVSLATQAGQPSNRDMKVGPPNMGLNEVKVEHSIERKDAHTEEHAHKEMTSLKKRRQRPSRKSRHNVQHLGLSLVSPDTLQNDERDLVERVEKLESICCVDVASAIKTYMEYLGTPYERSVQDYIALKLIADDELISMSDSEKHMKAKELKQLICIALLSMKLDPEVRNLRLSRLMQAIWKRLKINKDAFHLVKLTAQLVEVLRGILRAFE